MMSKAFSPREKALLVTLGLLLVFALYFMLVFRPTAEAMDAAQAQIDEVADLMIIEQAKAAQILKMREAMEQAEGEQGARSATPVFDNFENLLDELNTALRTADSYKLNFLTPVIADSVATRELNLVFYSQNYYAAKNIISKLYSGPYRCDITSFMLTPTERNTFDLASSPVTTTVSVLYYEIYKGG